MKDLEQLERDAIKEKETLENKALELFIKDFIVQDLEQIEQAENKLDSLKKKKDAKDLDFYKREFNKSDMRSGSCSTYKENYITKVK